MPAPSRSSSPNDIAAAQTLKLALDDRANVPAIDADVPEVLVGEFIQLVESTVALRGMAEPHEDGADYLRQGEGGCRTGKTGPGGFQHDRVPSRKFCELTLGIL